jgi:hypothetical protein
MKQPDLIAPVIESYEKTQNLDTFAEEMRELVCPCEDDDSSSDDGESNTKAAELVNFISLICSYQVQQIVP